MVVHKKARKNTRNMKIPSDTHTEFLLRGIAANIHRRRMEREEAERLQRERDKRKG